MRKLRQFVLVTASISLLAAGPLVIEGAQAAVPLAQHAVAPRHEGGGLPGCC